MPRELQIITDRESFGKLARIKHTSYKANEFYSSCYPIQNDSDMVEWLRVREEMELEAYPSQKVVAVIDTDTDKLLAWSKYKLPLHQVASDKLSKKAVEEKSAESAATATTADKNPWAKYHMPSLPEGSDWELQLDFRNQMSAKREKYYNPETDYSE